MSYRRLAIWCGIMGSAISLGFGLIAGITAVGPSYVVIAIAMGLVTGPVLYGLIWLIWNVRSEELTKKGHRW